MRGFRIFEKPYIVDGAYPPLRVVGILPDYVVGEAYEGRLDIIDNIGDCTVQVLDNNLPPGTTVTVDNLNMQVVVKWPAYSPPATEHPGIINSDFSADTLEGWIDRRGNSWRNSAYPPEPGGESKSPPYTSGRCALMVGVGRGDHILESILYPATPGQAVMARSLWDQGPSNKDNNNLWTGIGFFRADGSRIEPNPWYQWYGDRIHDRTNKTKHWTTANVITPPGAAFKTVQLIAHRRNGRNRWIAAGEVQVSGFEYATGTPPTSDDFYLTVKVTDSANRVAYWSGIISTNSVWLTSSPYPIISVESIGAAYSYQGIQDLREQIESFSVSYGLVDITINETVVYKQYDHPQAEAYSASYAVQIVTVTETVNYVTYAHPAHPALESFAVSYAVQAVTLTTTTAYVTYAHPAPESFAASYAVQGVTLT